MKSRLFNSLEADILQSVLVQVLPETHPEDFVAVATECAKAVKASIHLMMKPSLPDLGDKPCVHPGNMSGIEFSKYLRDVAGRIDRIAELQGNSMRYQELAPRAQRQFEEAKGELLEADGLLSQAATLFPENQKTNHLQIHPEGCIDQELPELHQGSCGSPLRHEEQITPAQSSALQ